MSDLKNCPNKGKPCFCTGECKQPVRDCVKDAVARMGDLSASINKHELISMLEGMIKPWPYRENIGTIECDLIRHYNTPINEIIEKVRSM